MHARSSVDVARMLFAAGSTPGEIARLIGLPVGTVRHWCRGDRRHPDIERVTCPRCHERLLDERQYAYLLGAYLGDGHITVGRRGVSSPSVFCGDEYPGVRAEVEEALRDAMPSSAVSSVARSGCRQVKGYSTHWTCLFPQHGPGTKHTRAIVLEPWQTALVERRPGRLLRGLFHSDGCRIVNWTQKRTARTPSTSSASRTDARGGTWSRWPVEPRSHGSTSSSERSTERSEVVVTPANGPAGVASPDRYGSQRGVPARGATTRGVAR